MKHSAEIVCGVHMEKWHAQDKCGPLVDNLSATGSFHAGVAAEFFRDLPRWDFQPAREQLRVDGEIPPYPKASSRKELDKAVTMAAVPGELYVVYIPKHNVQTRIVVQDLKPGTYSCLTDGRILVGGNPPAQGRADYLMTPDPEGKPKYERIDGELAKKGILDRISISPSETKVCFEYQRGFA